MAFDSALLGAILSGAGKSAKTIGKQIAEDERLSKREEAEEKKDSEKRKAETNKADAAERKRVMKVEADEIERKRKDRKETKKTEGAERERAFKREESSIKADKQAKEKEDSFDGRYNRWLLGKYKPQTEQESQAFRKKSGPSGKTKEERIPVGDKNMADAWNDWLALPTATADRFDDFEDYISKSEKATGQRFRRAADKEEPKAISTRESQPDVVSGPSVDEGIPPLPPNYEFPHGYNSVILGDKIRPISPEPAIDPPDANAPAQDSADVIDITDDLDPTYKHDPLRNPDAARADALFDRPRKTWTKEDHEFMEAYLETLGL